MCHEKSMGFGAGRPGENARSWEALGEARPGQSSLSAGALRYRAWAQSWSSAALAEPRGFSRVAVGFSCYDVGLQASSCVGPG